MQTLAYFSGPWQEADRSAILAVLEQVDAVQAESSPAAQRWVCNLYPSEQGALFTAARHGISRLFTARSADELAERLRTRTHAPLAA